MDESVINVYFTPLSIEAHIINVKRYICLREHSLIVFQKPGEGEVLFPPLCHLEVVGSPKVEILENKQVLVMPIKVNTNQKLMTIEDILGRRKQIAISIGFGVINDVDFDMRFISKVRKGVQLSSAEKDTVFRKIKNKIQGMNGIDAEWFNNDANLNKTLQECQELRKEACQIFINAAIMADDKEVSLNIRRFTPTSTHTPGHPQIPSPIFFSIREVRS
jgi:hypothetical protein